MKEVLTKSFWQGVKKTFYEALEEPRKEDSASQAAPEGTPEPSSAAEAPSVSSDQAPSQ